MGDEQITTEGTEGTENYGRMAILAMHHVQLAMPAGQEDAARVFYSDVLGFEELKKPDHLTRRGGAWFRSGSAELHLGIDHEFHPAKKAHPAFLVSDLDQLAEKCVAAGHAVVSDEPLDGFNRLYVSDPFGNRIELLEEKP